MTNMSPCAKNGIRFGAASEFQYGKYSQVIVFIDYFHSWLMARFLTA